MALQNTRLDALVSQYPNWFDQKETKFGDYAAMNAFIDQMKMANPILSNDTIKKFIDNYKIESQGGSTIEIPVLNNVPVVLDASMSCTPAATVTTDSGLVVTAAPVYLGFSFQEPSALTKGSNYISLGAIMNDELKRGFAACNTAINANCFTALGAGTNQLFDAPVLQHYPVIGNVYQIAAVDQPEMFGTIPTILSEMNFNDDLQIIGGTNLEAKVRHYMNQGGGNQVNLRYQFEGGNTKFYLGNSAAILDPNGKLFYAASVGSLGIMSRISSNYTDKSQSNIPGVEFKKIKDPTSGFEYAWNTTYKCGTDGVFLDGTVTHQIGAQFLVMTAYNSAPVTKYSPIIKALALS